MEGEAFHRRGTNPDLHLMRRQSDLLSMDWTAAWLAGGATLILSPWLSALHALPQRLLTGMALTSLAYGLFSYSLASRATRPLGLIRLLAGANVAWAAFCVVLVVTAGRSASLWGVMHLVGEALFVGGLGLLEWQARDRLRRAPGGVGDEGRPAT